MNDPERILLTGAGGFLARGFLQALSAEQKARCVALTRTTSQEVAGGCGTVVEGFFGDSRTLRELAPLRIGAVVHLAAVTGGCSEADAAAINVEGTRVLMRHLLDQGCRCFVLASSIAAVGIQRTDFRPLALPMADEHPCFDRDGYGFSKYLMEEQARYFGRQHADATIACLRFGSIHPDDAPPAPYQPTTTPPAWTYGWFSAISRRESVRALQLALAKRDWPGVHIMNIVGKRANLAVPMEKLVSLWHPDWKPDLSHYQRPGHECDAAYATDRAREMLGFEAS